MTRGRAINDNTSALEKVSIICNLFLQLLLFASLVYAISEVIVSPSASATEMTKSNYLLMAFQSLLGIAVLCLPFLLKKLGLIIPAPLKIVLVGYVLAAIYLGEVFSFYYHVKFWDSLCHFCSSLIFGILSLSFIYLLNKKTQGKGFGAGFIAIFVFCFSVTTGFIWEIIEFTIDAIFGSNMQKFIPTVDGIFNGGAGKEPLEGSMEMIADFFRKPSGYKYALMDTMKDIIVDFFGALLVAIFLYVIFKKERATVESFAIKTRSSLNKSSKNENSCEKEENQTTNVEKKEETDQD